MCGKKSANGMNLNDYFYQQLTERDAMEEGCFRDSFRLEWGVAFPPQLNNEYEQYMTTNNESLDTYEENKNTGLALITRHRPDAKYDFLRFQVGVMALRQMVEPIYDEAGERVIGERPLDRATCMVFNLLGFGVSLQKAKAMMMRNYKL